jgi:hypothetical protein
MNQIGRLGSAALLAILNSFPSRPDPSSIEARPLLDHWRGPSAHDAVVHGKSRKRRFRDSPTEPLLSAPSGKISS